MNAKIAVYIGAGLAAMGAAIAVVLGGGDAAQTLGVGGLGGLVAVAGAAGWRVYRATLDADADGDGVPNKDDAAPFDPDRS